MEEAALWALPRSVLSVPAELSFALVFAARQSLYWLSRSQAGGIAVVTMKTLAANVDDLRRRKT